LQTGGEPKLGKCMSGFPNRVKDKRGKTEGIRDGRGGGEIVNKTGSDRNLSTGIIYPATPAFLKRLTRGRGGRGGGRERREARKPPQ